jgi:asparagine synthetase B (glutamine-hydrolysing)
MRTTIELPDELMTRAKVRAAQEGITLKDLFLSAVEKRLSSAEKKKVRRPPPIIIAGGPVRDATREEIEEAMFPIAHIIEEIERSRR